MNLSRIIFLVICASQKVFQLEASDNSHCQIRAAAGTVVNGEASKPGQWPSLVGLYNVQEKKFRCGGTLITTQHVLTG